MRVLVAYDGSPAADAAIDQIVARPWSEGTRVRVVTVVETQLFYPLANGIEVYPPISEKIRAAMRENAYRGVQSAVAKLKAKPGIEPSYDLREGDVKSALLEAIREWKADLVIVGSHGKGALGRFFLGSVSHTLVTHAPCNVEVVRPTAIA